MKIIVRDEGAGIENRHLESIFDPYFTTKQAGSGLGLATSYSILQKHGGHINVESEMGEGTTFTIYIPAIKSGKSVSPVEKEEVELSIFKGVRILVMDDEDLIRTLLNTMLKRIECVVEFSSEGNEAISKYKQAYDEGNPFDIAIFDLTIPGGIGGKEAIKDILKIDPDAKVIVSSGYADDPVLSNYADYGFSGIAAKPYTFNNLQRVLSTILKKEN